MLKHLQLNTFSSIEKFLIDFALVVPEIEVEVGVGDLTIIKHVKNTLNRPLGAIKIIRVNFSEQFGSSPPPL
jgi:hypothetical protein